MLSSQTDYGDGAGMIEVSDKNSKIPSFYHIDPIEKGSFSGPAVSHERVGMYPRFGLVF